MINYLSKPFKWFFKLEAASGLVLLFAAIIALIISYGPPLKVANITLAISLGWPAAIVGIVSSAALLAERRWGVTLTLVSLSMVISGMGPYSIVRLITLQDIFGIGGFTLLTTLLSTLALLYWCNPKHRRSIRL